jgi:hypothetical protein
LGEVEQVGAFGIVELEGTCDRVEDRGGDAAEGTAFELCVVLNTHPGEGGDLAAPQPGDAALPCLRYPGLLGSDLGTPRGEELADFGTVVHVTTLRRDAVVWDTPSVHLSTVTFPRSEMPITWNP